MAPQAPFVSKDQALPIASQGEEGMPSLDWKDFQPCIRYLRQDRQEHVRDAFEFGKKMHAGQVRLSGEPHFSHCIAVTRMLTEAGE